MKPGVEKLRAWLGKYKLALLVLALGVVLLAWPTGGEQSADRTPATEQESAFDPQAVEQKLERVLARIEGAGEVTVALTVSGGVERRYAVDESRRGEEEQTQTVIISTGTGTQQAVSVGEHWPDFQGAVVVCQGGDDPEVRLLVTRAVCALTGLGADRVTVCKGT